MRACKCPNCGANLGFDDDGHEYIYCQFCGTKIDLMDYRTKHVEYTVHSEHIYDEARMKNAESIHRIVDIFASPFEERKRKKQEQEERIRREEEEAEREAERRREEEKARQQENDEAFDEFASGLGIFLAYCIKYSKAHPQQLIAIAAVILAIFAGGAYSSHVSEMREAASVSSRIEMGEVQYPYISSTYDDCYDAYDKFIEAGFTNVSLSQVNDLNSNESYKENRIIAITVNGLPSDDADDWYPSNAPVVIEYHALKKGVKASGSGKEALKDTITAAQDKIESKLDSAADSAMGKLSEMLNETLSDMLS